jgi:hypothetical protein
MKEKNERKKKIGQLQHITAVTPFTAHQHI